jgi:hypothetical protein
LELDLLAVCAASAVLVDLVVFGRIFAVVTSMSLMHWGTMGSVSMKVLLL